MNLAYPIEDIVEIDGKTYEIDMSFDNILRLFDLLKDESLHDVEKVEIGLKMLIGNDLNEYDAETRAEILVDLFKGAIGKGETVKENVDLDGNPMPAPTGSNKKAYDLTQDAELVYASFMHTYKIDLFEQQGKLHWHKFAALLNGLDEGSIFSRIVGIRTAELPSGKGMEKERERLQRLKREYALKEDDKDD